MNNIGDAQGAATRLDKSAPRATVAPKTFPNLMENAPPPPQTPPTLQLPSGTPGAPSSVMNPSTFTPTPPTTFEQPAAKVGTVFKGQTAKEYKAEILQKKKYMTAKVVSKK